MTQNIVLIVHENEKKEESLEKLCGFTELLAETKNSKSTLILFNADESFIIKASQKVDKIINIKIDPTEFRSELTSLDRINYLTEILKDINFSSIAFDQSIKSLEIGGFLSGYFKIGIITDIIAAKNNTTFSREAFQSKLIFDVSPETSQNVFIISGQFKQGIKKEKKAVVIEKNYTIQNLGVKCIKKDSRKTESSLDDAKIILSAGRAFTDKPAIEKIFSLSKDIPDSAVACSRPLVDSGLMEYSRQVGITGRSVSPQVYIAFGISGSTQHLYGMKNSEFIISVNKDVNAAIFNYSDICIVDDIEDFMKAFQSIINNN